MRKRSKREPNVATSYVRGGFGALGFACVMAGLGLWAGGNWPLWWAAGGAILAIGYFIAAWWRRG